MAQTMLATLALMMALMYSNDVSKRRIDFDRDNLSMEIEEMATSVALETLARIRELPYDDGLKPFGQYKGPDGRLLPGLTDQSILNDLGTLSASDKICKHKNGKRVPGKDEPEVMGYGVWLPGCSTMNDFNGMRPFLVAYPLANGEVVFEIDIAMTYVENSAGAMAPVSAPMLQKMVTVAITDVWKDGDRKGVFLPNAIRISRVFSLEV